MTHTYIIPRGLYDAAQSALTREESVRCVQRLFDAAYEVTGAKPGDTIILYDDEENQLAKAVCGRDLAIYGEDGEEI